MVGRDFGLALAEDVQQGLRLVGDADDRLEIKERRRSFERMKQAKDGVPEPSAVFSISMICGSASSSSSRASLTKSLTISILSS